MHNSCKRARQGGGVLGGWVPLTFDEREGENSPKNTLLTAPAPPTSWECFLIPWRFHVVQRLDRLSRSILRGPPAPPKK